MSQDAIVMLKADHKEVRGLFREFQKPSTTPARRGRLVEQIIELVEGDSPLALRNRALLELLYSGGLRSAEAVGLDLADVDFDREAIHVRGKGGKERSVPLGEEAAHHLALYLRDGRPALARGAVAAHARPRGGRRCGGSGECGHVTGHR